MRMHLVCYWQGNTEQSWQLQEYLGFFRDVQRGDVSPEGFELPVTSSPKPCRVGRAHTHVPLKDTAMMTSHPYLKTLRGTRGGTLSQVPTHTQAKGATPQRQISKCFGSATSENLLYAQLFPKKPTTIWEALSSCTGCQISILALNQPFWVACLVALCCLLSKLIIPFLLFAFYVFLQPSQKKLTCYCTSTNCTLFHVFWPTETLCCFSLSYSGPM